MVDDELHRLQRVHFVGIAAKPHDAVAHRREVDDGRHAGEVLKKDAGRLYICAVRPPAAIAVRVPKVFTVAIRTSSKRRSYHASSGRWDGWVTCEERSRGT